MALWSSWGAQPRAYESAIRALARASLVALVKFGLGLLLLLFDSLAVLDHQVNILQQVDVA